MPACGIEVNTSIVHRGPKAPAHGDVEEQDHNAKVVEFAPALTPLLG